MAASRRMLPERAAQCIASDTRCAHDQRCREPEGALTYIGRHEEVHSPRKTHACCGLRILSPSAEIRRCRGTTTKSPSADGSAATRARRPFAHAGISLPRPVVQSASPAARRGTAGPHALITAAGWPSAPRDDYAVLGLSDRRLWPDRGSAVCADVLLLMLRNWRRVTRCAFTARRARTARAALASTAPGPFLRLTSCLRAAEAHDCAR